MNQLAIKYASNGTNTAIVTPADKSIIIWGENGITLNQSKVSALDVLFDDRDDDELFESMSDDQIEKMSWSEIAAYGMNNERSVSVTDYLSSKEEISADLLYSMRDAGLLTIDDVKLDRFD